VLGYLTQFAGKANRLGAVGLAVLFVTALALVMTIDRTLNGIWRVKRPRPLGQRILVYWAVMTLGPLLLGASLSLTSYVISASRGVVAAVPGGLQLLFDVIEFFLLATGLAALYRFVPNTPVRWAHAWSGALFATVGIELARRLLAIYLGKVPTYSVVYGAFATVPILLLWIYIVWLIVLWGAVIAAYLPSLLAGRHRPRRGPSSRFELALDVLKALNEVRASPQRGLTSEQLADAVRAEAQQLEPVIEALVALDWVARLNEAQDEERTRFMLLADTSVTPIAPLVQRLLLPQSDATAGIWRASALGAVTLKDAL
jgi:membrane protein